jgi:hypothetical protein
MNNRFFLKEDLDKIQIKDLETNYTLCILLKEVPEFHKVCFYLPITAKHVGHKGISGIMAITGRRINDYHPDIANLVINENNQYIEVGAGLGEFSFKVSKLCKKMPIIIDPVDYCTLYNLLYYSKILDLDETYEKKIDLFIERCEKIINNYGVKLINLSLSDALEKMPELENLADVVVENFGPSYYPHTENEDISTEKAKKLVYSLEKRLLKQNGMLIIK